MKTGPLGSAQAGKAAQDSVWTQAPFSAPRVFSRWTLGEAVVIRRPISGEDIVDVKTSASGPKQHGRKHP
ncbi:hypothetical protein BH11GEM2_BH11GEM2_39390 [soil metagenome]